MHANWLSLYNSVFCDIVSCYGHVLQWTDSIRYLGVHFVRESILNAPSIGPQCHYRASSALAVYAMVVCPSVCPSVTSRCSTKTAKRRICLLYTSDAADE